MSNFDKVNELNRRLSALSPEKRALLERTLHKSVGDRPIGKQRSAVIQLQEDGDKLPIYFIYAGPDEIRLAQMLGTERSIFGVDVPWPKSWRDAATNNEIAALPTMEQLVAPFVDALSAHRGSSPCVLAGHSFAGLMAFEAAHQLGRRGAEVKMVMLFDSWARFPRLHQIVWGKLREDWKGMSNGPEMDRFSHLIRSRLISLWQISRWLLGEEAKALWSAFKWLQSVFNPAMPTDLGKLMSLRDEEGVPLHWLQINRVYEKALKSYRFRPLNSHGVLFRAPESRRDIYAFYRSLGWEEDSFVKGLEIIRVPGNHISMIRKEEHGLFLTQKMKEALKQYGTN